MGYVYNRYKMSTKMSKQKSKMSKTAMVGFSKEQKEILEYMMKEKISECVENIMNSDSEGDDFEGDRDSFVGLFEKVFTFKSLKEIKNDFNGDISIRGRSKKEKKVKDPNMPKKFKTAYFIWLWNEDNEIGMSKIKNDFPLLTHKQALSKAGEIWKSMLDTQKEPFIEKSKEDKVRYDKELLQYKETKNELTEVVETKKKGKQKKSVTKEEASSADTDEETEVDTNEEIDNFEIKENQFLYGYTKKNSSDKFETLKEAVSALECDKEATGIVKDKNGKYTVRKGKVYKDTPESKKPEICWKKL